MVYLKSVVTLCLLLSLIITAVNGDNTLHHIENSPDIMLMANSSRIIHGTNPRAPISYQVFIQISHGTVLQKICSGSIITEDRILTAASCVDRRNKDQIFIWAGVTDITSLLGTRHTVLDVIVHENYLSYGINNIAILQITPALVLNGDTITTIDYSNTDVVGDGIPVLISGWGVTNILYQELSYPKKLKIMSSTTLSNARCKKFRRHLTDAEICTYRRDKSACIGDSGGPVTNLAGTSLIAIISSHEYPCGNHRPNIHTRVSSYIDWIQTNIKQLQLK